MVDAAIFIQMLVFISSCMLKKLSCLVIVAKVGVLSFSSDLKNKGYYALDLFCLHLLEIF